VWHDRRVLSAVSIVARLASELVGSVALAFQSRQSLHAEVLFPVPATRPVRRAGREAEADRCSNAGELGVAAAAIPVALRAGRGAAADGGSFSLGLCQGRDTAV